jgi:hypothetical protein
MDIVAGTDVYFDNFGEYEAEESGWELDCPFGDSTYRVIDENEGGVVAYFNNEADASIYTEYLLSVKYGK